MTRVNNGLDECSCELIFVKGCYELGDSPGASHTCGKLDEDLSSCFMDLVHKFLKLFKHFGILPEPFAPEGVAKGSDTGNDKTNIIVGAL